jgi:hypothetical protein
MTDHCLSLRLFRAQIAMAIVAVLLSLFAGVKSARGAPTYVPGTELSCQATLPNGMHYAAYGRFLKASYRGKTVFVDVRAYYKPGSGEFLWFGPAYPEHVYQSTVKDRTRTAEELCQPKYPHLLIFQDHEWVEFLPSGDKVQVLHCNLRFPTIALAWQYVARYWDEASYSAQNWSTWVDLSKDLGADFFRPPGDSAAPYNYNFISSAKKTSDAWQVEIKSADEAKRALITFNVNFLLLKITRLPG